MLKKVVWQPSFVPKFSVGSRECFFLRPLGRQHLPKMHHSSVYSRGKGGTYIRGREGLKLYVLPVVRDGEAARTTSVHDLLGPAVVESTGCPLVAVRTAVGGNEIVLSWPRRSGEASILGRSRPGLPAGEEGAVRETAHRD